MGSEKVLVAFFSHSGHTRRAAEIIAGMVRGDLFEIKTVEEYPADYSSATVRARNELREKARPALAERPADIAAYGMIILGYPNWWGTAPMPVLTFLEAEDLSGKTLLPFCLHGGGGLGRSVRDIGDAVPGAIVREGLAIRDGGSAMMRGLLAEWLSGYGYR